MYIPRKRHRQIVLSLAGIIALLLTFLVLVVLYFNNQAVHTFLQERFFRDASEQLATPAAPFLQEEEVVIIPPQVEDEPDIILPVEKPLFEYVEVIDSCGPHYEGECLNVRAGPGTEYPSVAQLREGIVLKVGGIVERDGVEWYKIIFDEWLRYPDRVQDDWYVIGEYVQVLLDEGDKTVWEHGTASTTKRIVVDRSEQKLYAYEGDGTLFMELAISTGLALTPTPRGTFTVFKKTPSRYMQGPLPNIPSDDYYDLPGVPWNLYFTEGGAVIHGAYWHNSFGSPYSHGCVNLPVEAAHTLYNWAELGTEVLVRD